MLSLATFSNRNLMNYFLKNASVLILMLLTYKASSQGVQPGQLGGQDLNRRPITVAVPFLSFAPDSRSSAMGDVGVATSADAASVHWNNAKLAFVDSDILFSFSYSPWLGTLVDDMSLNYLTFSKKIDQTQAFGVTLRYFDLGEIQLVNDQGVDQGIENPNEVAIDGTYSRKLSERMGIGATFRFIWSNLAGNLNNAVDAKAGTSVAIDLGWYYTRPIMVAGMNSDLSFGAHLSNIGQKVTYSTKSNESFIPGNLRLGTAFKTSLDPYNTITLAVDFNKLLVPTPPIIETDENGEEVIIAGKDPNRSLLSGTFGSFTDAPNGFQEELQEITYSFGAEYWYQDVFSFRAGYFHEHENKGDRKYLTLGAGFRYQVFGVDFSYLVPTAGKNHPLADTLRISLLFSLDKVSESETGL